jgi:hypothetical protein
MWFLQVQILHNAVLYAATGGSGTRFLAATGSHELFLARLREKPGDPVYPGYGIGSRSFSLHRIGRCNRQLPAQFSAEEVHPIGDAPDQGGAPHRAIVPDFLKQRGRA